MKESKPAERPQVLNFGLNVISIDFENKCKEVLQFYNKKAWINPVT